MMKSPLFFLFENLEHTSFGGSKFLGTRSASIRKSNANLYLVPFKRVDSWVHNISSLYLSASEIDSSRNDPINRFWLFGWINNNCCFVFKHLFAGFVYHEDQGVALDFHGHFVQFFLGNRAVVLLSSIHPNDSPMALELFQFSGFFIAGNRGNCQNAQANNS